jgi:hypothetical protein
LPLFPVAANAELAKDVEREKDAFEWPEATTPASTSDDAERQQNRSNVLTL